MKKILILIAFIAITSVSYGQSKLYGGLAYSNVGPKAEFGLTEYFDEGGFMIKTSASYSYEYNHEFTAIDGVITNSDIHHLSIASVILFNVGNFDLGGGFAYRFFLPSAAGSVGLELAALYHINEKYDIQLALDRTVSGSNFASIGVNFNIF
ncbi:MAG: hypothetical protein ABFR62_03285 [Bacteroidota bacterium]